MAKPRLMIQGRRWRAVRGAVLAVAGLIGLVPALAQEGGAERGGATPAAVPSYRQADRVAIITVEGAINSVTELSIKRRIEQAEQSGADAMVFEIDSPGGEVGAVLEITNAIKASQIGNTVAWVHPDAYSGGAIVALACREIVVSSPAAMGDAFPVTMSPTGIRGLTADERTKLLPPLLGEVADSARRSGYDEYLVQAMVVDGIELWAVRDRESGRWIFINENEYRTLFEGDPPRGKPLLTSVPGGREARRRAVEGLQAEREGPPADEGVVTPEMTPTGPDDDATDGAPGAEASAPGSETDSDSAQGPDQPPGAASEPVPPAGPSPADEADQPDPGGPPGTRFLPAGSSVADLESAVSDTLTVASQRPQFTRADRGRYVDPVYISDGTGPLVMRDDQLLRFGIAVEEINSDEQLRAFFGAKELARSEMNWSEHLVGFLTNPIVRGVLIVLFLLGLFIEMTSPGLFVPGVVAMVALGAILAPPLLIGMAGWWEILAIGLGIALLIVEVLILPGFGVFGVLGVVSLFVGLIGTFIPDGSGGLFGGGPGGTAAALSGLVTVLLATFTAGVGMYFIAKRFQSLPVLNRLILDENRPREDEEEDGLAVLAAAAPPPLNEPQVGDRGVTATPLRPSGRVELEGRLHDAIARRGLIESGVAVRVVERRGFSWVVEPAAAAPPPPAAGPGAEGDERAV